MDDDNQKTMPFGDGELVPDYPVGRISVKGTFRRDLGDLGPLIDSIRQLGLLTPVVVTQAGHLLCGKRRLAAARHLGWETVPVWIPAKVSPLLRTVAMFDDETLHKPLTVTEQATLYDEYEKLYAAQAHLRQEATRFGAAANGLDAGWPESSSPMTPASPEAPAVLPSRQAAALAVTGKKSATRLDQVRDLQHLAVDDAEPPAVRDQAVEALARVDVDGKVNPRWEQVKLAQLLAVLDTITADTSQADEVRAVAADAVSQARGLDATSDGLQCARQGLEHVDRLRKQTKAGQQAEAAARRDAAQVARIIASEVGWWELCDPDDFWAHADEYTRHLVETYIAGVRGFAERAGAAHIASASEPRVAGAHLPAVQTNSQKDQQ